MKNISPYVAVVGRVKKFYEDPDAGTLPVSCTIHVSGFDDSKFDYSSHYVCDALIKGAGINIHLDDFQSRPRVPTGGIMFYLSEDHPEFQSANGTPAPIQYLDFTFTPTVPYSSEANRWFVVSDSILEDNQNWFKGANVSHSIMNCVIQAYRAGRVGSSIQFDLSGIRPENVINPKGLSSSGAKSFAYLLRASYKYGQLGSLDSLLYYLSSFNGVLRRGGTYKNGALTTTLPFNHPNIYRYLTINSDKHPWLKKGVAVHADWLDPETFNSQNITALITGVNDGSLWLEKVVSPLPYGGGYHWHTSAEPTPDRVRSNVCREILIIDRATCNLSHVNYGQIRNLDELPSAYLETMDFLLNLHGAQDTSQYYLPSSEDRQVGLGVIGLANLLRNFGIPYRELVKALRYAVLTYGDLIGETVYGKRAGLPPIEDLYGVSTPEVLSSADTLSYWLCVAFAESGRLAHRAGFVRAFTVAPTANSSYNHEDYRGFTTTPEISPPLYREVERVSEVPGQESREVFYGEVETLEEVGSQTYFDLANVWQQLMNATGLGHSISFNVTEPCDLAFLKRWSNSSLITTYYRIYPKTKYMDKSDQFGINCACAG